MATEKKDSDLPSEFIWGSHMLMGIFFIYVGYFVLTKKSLPTYVPLIVVVLGALAFLFHSHLWFNKLTS
jgi:hypothetical protein